METITVGSPGPLRSPARTSGRHRRPGRIQWRRHVLATLLTAVAFVSAAAAPARSATVDEPRFTWPLSPTPAVTRGFEPPADAYGAGHRGVDLAAAPGQQALAAGPGVVVFAGTLAGRGVVSVDHEGGLRTTYEPVTPDVSVGDQIYQGQPLGTVLAGHPGCTVAACLHWGVRRGDEYVNPLEYIATAYALRLKPWDG